MTLHRKLKKMNLNPRKLFLIDSFGALITALLLSLVLARFEDTFGMPRKVLYILSGMAGVYCIYSFLCYWHLKNNWSPYLKIIATANLIYCGLTMVLMFYFYQSLTILGLLYFIGEIIIITILALTELDFARTQQKREGS